MSVKEEIRILIVEDDPIIADEIAMMLEKNGYQISEIVDNADDACDHLGKNSVNLALLDINIEGDRDGISLAHQINKDFQVPFVFLTAYYDNNTLKRAKATNPFGYIVKPFDEGDLKANVELALFKAKQSETVPNVDKFFVREGQALKALEAENILYVEGLDNYSNVFTVDSKHMVSHTLKSVAEKLAGKAFVRIHKSYIINFSKVTSISEGYLFINEVKLPIGRTYRSDFTKRISIL